MCTVTSNASIAAYLFDRSSGVFQTTGENSDTTTSIIRVDFPSSKVVDRIVLEDVNFKTFSIFYDSLTSNYFSVTGALTATTNWTANSETSLYLKLVTPITLSSISIAISSTQVANEEKELGEFWISKQRYAFTLNPTAADYKIKRARKAYTHEMSDGGYAQYILGEKFEADIKRRNILEAEETQLETLYMSHDDFVFVPEPTGTSWNGKIFECTWIGDYDFEEYETNYKPNGFTGSLRLRETPL
jgi:hypothetical protein